jgi:hypothetical protein
MSDEPFHTPAKKLTPPKHYWPASSERLWEISKDHVTWSADLRFQGESYGWEAFTLRNGELSRGQLFVGKKDAIAWAEYQRVDIANGLIEEEL